MTCAAAEWEEGAGIATPTGKVGSDWSGGLSRGSRLATSVLAPASRNLLKISSLLPTPPCRQLRRLTLDDAAAASHVFTVLMGDKVAPRRQLIEEQGARYSLEELDV